ncbi:UNVERIFIED_CONTAM: hypothetical protein Slati_3712300 [Sesamum latifolium]|uniref:Uncharacterized protein n=1 Tax=Sesamum latifolium TaxID=2727402 RepID=A0AAW2U657_9LAMI
MLLELLESPPTDLSPLVQEASAYSLKCIASQGEGRLANLIGQMGAVPILLRLLPNSEEGLQRALLKCLRNVIRSLILLEILSTLALIREVRKVLWRSRKAHHLVEAARCGSLVSRTRAAQAIGLLGLIKRARRTLVNAGALQVLMQLLKEGDTTVEM